MRIGGLALDHVYAPRHAMDLTARIPKLTFSRPYLWCAAWSCGWSPSGLAANEPPDGAASEPPEGDSVMAAAVVRDAAAARPTVRKHQGEAVSSNSLSSAHEIFPLHTLGPKGLKRGV